MAEPSAAAAAMLVAHLRRQRPVRAGSLIVSVFGDALAARGGAISLASLIRLAAAFGLTERLVRTAAARLAVDDWLATRRSGRLSEYRLSPTGRLRFLEATRRIYAGPTTDWDRHWTLVLMPGLDLPQRRRIREALAWEGFGELGPGLFAHPTLTPADARQQLGTLGLHAVPAIFEARASGRADERRLLERGWDRSDLAARYQRFIARFAPVRAALRRRTPEPAAAFVIRTLLIHEYRRIHLRDPLLPHSLLPRHWPGAAAYELCRTLYARVLSASEEHLSRAACRLDGPLPPPDAALFQRFGG
ncbi:MAG: phenylacetic acid degradation operon negative regulatory protein PaaX [Gammaproteobacteria bacterium]|nr:phenylacetic acid degradation operon negative regulatory protein PaaX [Gammaproteobacteria bacterium]